jgi:tetratricopeptide (TPR) repeat protein/transcriptional regulator with XRE-family HTH domain
MMAELAGRRDPGPARELFTWVRSQQDLTSLLRQLRRREARRRGGRELTYRELAAKTGWSHAIIGQYLTGKVLPPTDRFDALIRILGAQSAEQGALATARDRIEELRRTPSMPAGSQPAGSQPGGSQPGSSPDRAPDEPSGVTPRQLPLAARHFTGRQAELAVMTDLADQAARADGTVVIVVIDGTAGIGKTALAVHAAHRAADRFPDGQLYVDLRGFDPAGLPVEPSDAIRGFLDAFVVPGACVPAGFDAQVGLYRSFLAGRRMLVLLDNARDVAQVRPLLPGTAGCLVVVTSRNRLAGLILAEHAQPLTLGLLPATEAHDLLASRLGADRMAAEREAAQEIIDQCAGLPLALSIVASRAAAQPCFPLAALAAELPHTPAGLAGPHSGHPDTDVREVFSWSYHRLRDQSARLFRLLGLHSGPDIGAVAAAALAGTDTSSTRAALAELANAHLQTEQAPGRFACHDLLRAYASELAHTLDAEDERQAALARVYDYYLHTAQAAAGQLDPAREPITLAPPRPGITPGTFTSCDDAFAWFTGEHRVLLASIDLARREQWDGYTWQLAWSIAGYLDRRGYWDDWAATQHASLAAARRLKDQSGEAHAHRGIGCACDRLGRPDEAGDHLRQALGLYRKLGSRAGEAETRLDLAGLCERQGRHQESLAHAQQALRLFHGTDHQARQADALAVIGWLQAKPGEPSADRTGRAHRPGAGSASGSGPWRQAIGVDAAVRGWPRPR